MKAAAFRALAGREWKTSWNDGTGYLLRSGYAGLLLLGAAVAWTVAALDAGLQPAEHAEFSRVLYRWFFRLQFLVSTLAAMASYARTFMREKERRSLDLLLISPAGPWSILQAKALGDLGGMLVLQLAGLPILLFLVPLGGITLGKIFSVELLVAGQTAAIGGISAILSALFARTTTVLGASGIAVFGYLTAPGLVALLDPKRRWLGEALLGVNPWHLLEREMNVVGAEWGTSMGVLGAGLGILLGGCVLGALLLRTTQVAAAGRGWGEGFWGRTGRRIRGLLAGRSLGFLLRTFVSPKRTLLHRECSLERDVPFRIFLILWMALYLLAVTLALKRGLRSKIPEIHAGIALLGGLTALIVLIARGAVTSVLDKRSGRFEMLLAANVEPEEIVRSRLAGQLQRGFYLFLLPAIHAACLVVFADASGENLIRIPLGLAGLALGVIVAALWTQESSILTSGLALAVLSALIPGVPVAGIVFILMSVDAAYAAVTATFLIPAILGLYAIHVRHFRWAALRR